MFRVLAFLAESAVFLYLGLSVFALGYGAHYRATLIAAAAGACLVARACHVYPIACLVNRLAEPRIPTRTQHMLWFSGLRGAVAFACAANFPNARGHRKDVLVTTMSVVLVSVFALGGTTVAVLHRLGIARDVELDEQYRPPAPGRVVRAILRVDEEYLRPWLCCPPPPPPPPPPTRNPARPQAEDPDADADAERAPAGIELARRRPSLYDFGRA